MDRTRSGIGIITVIAFVRLVLIIVTSLTSHPETPTFDPTTYDLGPVPTFDLTQLEPHTVPMIGPDGEVEVTVP